MKTLILFWHGIGDCVLSTPALKAYAKKHPKEEIYLAATKPVLKSGFFDHCPYVKKVFLLENAWDVKPYLRGVLKVRRIGKELAKKKGMDKVLMVTQHYIHGIHKLDRTAKELGVSLGSKRYEVFITDKDRKEAKAWLKKKNIKEFVFLHRITDIPNKDLPKRTANNYLNKQFPGLTIIEPGITFPFTKHINFSFALMEMAKGIVVVDSVFMHAAAALKRNVDFAYFNLRPGLIEEVRPLGIKVNYVEGPATKHKRRALMWKVKRVLIKALNPVK